MNIAKELVHIPSATVLIEGELSVPGNSRGIVLFAHGSGSSRHSPRNNFVASLLHANGLATLLMDLLTPDEDKNYATRFDIELLTQRLVAATSWIQNKLQTQYLPIGYFGASTGAAAALKASVVEPSVRAVVSRGGRPDLAGNDLTRVTAPVLLLVGSHDYGVIELNEDALKQIPATKELILVPGATHLFEEAGTLEQVANQAADWFKTYLPAAR